MTNEPGGHRYLYDDVRMVATGTLNAVNKTWLRISMNASTGNGGTCYGDSGGPNFLGTTNVIAGDHHHRRRGLPLDERRLPAGHRVGAGLPRPVRDAAVSALDRQAATCLWCRRVGDVFKALADPTRRAILDELQERSGQTLFELCTRLITRHGLGSSRQAVSQHLDVLEDAGLVRTRREGRYKFHDLDTSPLRTIAERWPTDP